MDYCLTLSVLRSTISRIGFVIEPPTLLPSSVFDDLRNLKSVFLMIHRASFVGLSVNGGDQEALRVWLSELKEIAYCADDVVAECGYEVLQAAVGLRPYFKITSLASYPAIETGISAYLASRLREVVCKSEQIIRKLPAVKFGKKLSGRMYATTRVDSGTQTLPAISLVNEPCIFGREQEKEGITKFLFSTERNTDNVSVLAIVGQAGVGKTALAQLVYNNPITSYNFELQGWVNVSDDFCITNITRNILQSFRKKECFLKDQTRLQKELVRELTGKRFFIVLDGLHHENKSLWERFLAPFLYAQSGKIIITTHSASTAEILQTTPLYLKELPFEHCWSMFEKSAFRSLDANSQGNLLEMSKRIVSKCRGIPLFVKAVASALKLENEWVHVLKSDLWDQSSFSEVIDAPLRICYDRMPIMSKQCFLFLSMYPNGHVFFKEDLIKLWMSVSLLQEEGKEPIDVGSLVFDELLQRALLQPAHGVYGKKDGFLMHHLVHDFARSFAGQDFVVIKHDCLHDISTDIRYLSIIVPDLPEILNLQPLKKCRYLRVLQILNQGDTWKYDGVKIEIPDELFKHFKYLRSLIIRDTNLETLPDSIGDLKLLQSLDLTNTCIERLPQSICLLYHLQVLELTNCPLKELPQRIGNMVNLQILNFGKSFGLCLPRGIGNLINLRTLPRFDVKRCSWHYTLSELKDLVKLKGELFIGGLGNLTSVEEARDPMLQNKIHLEVLTLDWSSEPSPTCSHSTELSCTSAGAQVLTPHWHSRVFEILRPHTNLVELHINEYHGSKFPSWLGDPSFSRLVKISLIGGCKVVPTLGQLRNLRNLSIQMSDVMRVDSEFSSGIEAANGFQSLKMLEFSDMFKWHEWTGVKSDDFASLQSLKLIDCPQLRVLPEPLSSSLTELVITNCGMLSRLPMLHCLRSLSLSEKVSEDMLRCLDLPLLRTLKVCQSRNIRSLPLNYMKLPSLQRLIIHGCRNLESVVGINALSSLNFFKISACQNLQISLNEKLPQTLRYLVISNCTKLLDWKRIQEVKYCDQLHIYGGQAYIESVGSERHFSGTIENDPSYKGKELYKTCTSVSFILNINLPPSHVSIIISAHVSYKTFDPFLCLRVHFAHRRILVVRETFIDGSKEDDQQQNNNNTRENVLTSLSHSRDSYFDFLTNCDLEGASNALFGNEDKDKLGQDVQNNELSQTAVSNAQLVMPQDGYEWKKYGQKYIQNIKMLRSYFKCKNKTCNVKKKVEWHPSDPSNLRIVYEGTHEHKSRLDSDQGSGSGSGSIANEYDLANQVFGPSNDTF